MISQSCRRELAPSADVVPEWSARETEQLESGQLVLKKGTKNGIPQGMASQRVHAPLSMVSSAHKIELTGTLWRRFRRSSLLLATSSA